MKIVVFNKDHDRHYFYGYENGDILFVYGDGYPRDQGVPGLDSVISIPDAPKDTISKFSKAFVKETVTTFRGDIVENEVPNVRIRFDLLPQHAQDKILIARKGSIPFGLLKNAMFKRNGKKWDEED